MKNLSATTLTALIIVATTTGMATPLLIWWFRDPDRFVSDLLDLDSATSVSAVAWAATVTVIAAYVIASVWAVPEIRANLWTMSPLKMLAIPLALTTGTMEELVFRKFLMDGLAGAEAGIATQVLASAVAFGAAHAVWVFFARDKSIALPVIVATTTLGAALAVVYIASDRAILPVIIAHIVINLVIEPWLLLSAVTGAWKRADESTSPSE